MDKLHSGERRKHLRFEPATTDRTDILKCAEEVVAHVCLSLDSDPFTSDVVGLILDLSHSGCSLAMARKGKRLKEADLKKDMKVRVKAGRLHPLQAQVRWTNKIDEDLVKVGLEFLE